MDNFHMNTSLGTAWFTFYTKIRPWFACLISFSIIIDFFEYIEVYSSYWWMMLSFISSITQSVFAIMVFVKSRGDYIDFVRFVKGVLLFETINVAYQQAVQQYINSSFEISSALVIFAIILILAYFVWYRLNVKYFEKRILVSSNLNTEITNNYQPDTYTHPHTQTSDNLNVCFCRKCGQKLACDSSFCSRCGTKVVEAPIEKGND